MSYGLRFSIDVMNKTARLEFLPEDGVPVVNVDYVASAFTLVARGPVSLAVVDMRVALYQVDSWLRTIQEQIGAVAGKRSPFTFELEKTTDELAMRLTINGQSVVDAKWTPGGLVVFAPRLAVTFTLADELYFIERQIAFLREIETF